MPLLQSFVQVSRRVIPRGWAPLLRMAAHVDPRLHAYPVRLVSGDRLIVDLRQPMCMTHLFHGCLPHNRGFDRLMAEMLGPGSVFVDVGANIGYYTRYGCRLVGADGHVHAFEPLPSALPLLRANVAEFANVTIHPVALGSATGEVDFFAHTLGDRSSLHPDAAAERVRVRLTTLDLALDTPRLDLLKIDVEGFELEVLRGAREKIRAHEPVIQFEFLGGYADALRLDLADYAALLEPLGYALYWNNHGPGPAVVSGPPSGDVVAVPPRWLEALRLA